MSFPGQPNWPGFTIRLPRRRKKTRKRAAPAGVDLAQPGGEFTAVAIVATQTGQPLRVVAAEWPRCTGRPETYEHPLAIAARLGRRRFAARAADLPDPDDPAQVRAFEVARDRARAVRWGWKQERWALAAGVDNRSERRHRR